MLDTEIDDELKLIGVSREITNRIQKLRKAANVQPEDPIVVYYEVDASHETLSKVLKDHSARIEKQVKRPFKSFSDKGANESLVDETKFEYQTDKLEQVKLHIYMAKS